MSVHLTELGTLSVYLERENGCRGRTEWYIITLLDLAITYMGCQCLYGLSKEKQKNNILFQLIDSIVTDVFNILVVNVEISVTTILFAYANMVCNVVVTDIPISSITTILNQCTRINTTAYLSSSVLIIIIFL